MPEVSIIMPNYNCAAFISEAIESVLAQTYQDWQLIICDDCSNDSSIDIIRQYAANEPRISFIVNSSNRGAGESRNMALRQAAGTYIAFFDSDDIWYPQKLDVQMRYIHSHSIDICYSAFDMMTEDRKINHVIIPRAKPVAYVDILKGHRIDMLTSVVKRSVFIESEALPAGALEDYRMWLGIMRRGYLAHAIRTPLACYRLRKKSLSAQKIRTACLVWKILRDQEKLPLPKRAYYFSCYAIIMLRKYARILPEVLRLR